MPKAGTGTGFAGEDTGFDELALDPRPGIEDGDGVGGAGAPGEAPEGIVDQPERGVLGLLVVCTCCCCVCCCWATFGGTGAQPLRRGGSAGKSSLWLTLLLNGGGAGVGVYSAGTGAGVGGSEGRVRHAEAGAGGGGGGGVAIAGGGVGESVCQADVRASPLLLLLLLLLLDDAIGGVVGGAAPPVF